MEYSPTMIYKALDLNPRPYEPGKMKHAYNLTSLEAETGKEFKVILSNRIIFKASLGYRKPYLRKEIKRRKNKRKGRKKS